MMMLIRRCLAVLVTAALLAPCALAGEGNGPSWFEKLKFKGDLRLRYEGFKHTGKYEDGQRDRFRLRYRLGLVADISEGIRIGAELRSGNRLDPVSDNQTLDEGFSKKEIALAQMYVDFALSRRFSLIAGKFSPKKLWKVSDMQIDDDVVSEGAMGRWTFGGSDGALDQLHANAWLYVLEESSSGPDAYAWGGQIYPVFDAGAHAKLTVGVGYETMVRPEVMASLTLDGKIKGNKMTHFQAVDGSLVSDFQVANAFVEWKNSANKRWPVKVSAFFYKNLGANGEGKNNDSAYFARLQIGDYKKPGQMAFRLSRYYSEPDAIFYAWTQSDSTRGSNLDGYRFDYRVGLHSGGIST
ncbi:MAG: putative porin [Acidobacteriota bacterium]|nr:putative porin [Acidobacteriota bacterium]